MNDMRDMLIELLDEAIFKSDDNFGMPITSQVADHLLANGVILPPCKVGDELFRIIKITNSACKPFVPTLPDKVEPYGIFYKGLMGEYRCIPFEEFGKTVFLTREEAKKALREQENV